MTPSRNVPRWAWAVAYLAPLSVLPSCLFRLFVVIPGSTDIVWYLWLLDTFEFGTALLTLGLVHRWGEVWPRWIPGLSGRTIPPKAALVPGWTGGTIVAIWVVYGVGNLLFGWVAQGPILVGENRHFAPPETYVYWLYAPTVAWPLALFTSLVGYRKRHAHR